MQMHIPLLEVQIIPKSRKNNFCYSNTLLKALPEAEVAKERAFWLGVFEQEYGLEIDGENFSYAKKNWEELKQYELLQFGPEKVGSYCHPNFDPYFTPVIVEAPYNIYYDSVNQMFEDLFNYTDTIRGKITGCFLYKF